MNHIDFTPPQREPTFREFNYNAARSLAAVPPEVSHRLYYLRPDYVRFLREYMENYDESTLLLLRKAYEVSEQNLRVKEKRQTRGRDFGREEKNLVHSEGEVIWYMTAGFALDSEERWRKLIHEGAKRATVYGKQRDQWLPGMKYAAVPTEQLMSLKEKLDDFRENFERAKHEMEWREGVVDLTYFSFLKSYYLTLVPRITVLDNRSIALRLPWFINEAFINFRKDHLNRQLETCNREDKEIVKTAFHRLQLLSETRMKEHDHLLNTMNTLNDIAQEAFFKEPRKELCKLLGVRGPWPEAPPQREISEASFQFLHDTVYDDEEFQPHLGNLFWFKDFDATGGIAVQLHRKGEYLVVLPKWGCQEQVSRLEGHTLFEASYFGPSLYAIAWINVTMERMQQLLNFHVKEQVPQRIANLEKKEKKELARVYEHITEVIADQLEKIYAAKKRSDSGPLVEVWEERFKMMCGNFLEHTDLILNTLTKAVETWKLGDPLPLPAEMLKSSQYFIASCVKWEHEHIGRLAKQLQGKIEAIFSPLIQCFIVEIATPTRTPNHEKARIGTYTYPVYPSEPLFALTPYLLACVDDKEKMIDGDIEMTKEEALQIISDVGTLSAFPETPGHLRCALSIFRRYILDESTTFVRIIENSLAQLDDPLSEGFRFVKQYEDETCDGSPIFVDRWKQNRAEGLNHAQTQLSEILRRTQAQDIPMLIRLGKGFFCYRELFKGHYTTFQQAVEQFLQQHLDKEFVFLPFFKEMNNPDWSLIYGQKLFAHYLKSQALMVRNPDVKGKLVEIMKLCPQVCPAISGDLLEHLLKQDHFSPLQQQIQSCFDRARPDMIRDTAVEQEISLFGALVVTFLTEEHREKAFQRLDDIFFIEFIRRAREGASEKLLVEFYETYQKLNHHFPLSRKYEGELRQFFGGRLEEKWNHGIAIWIENFAKHRLGEFQELCYQYRKLWVQSLFQSGYPPNHEIYNWGRGVKGFEKLFEHFGEGHLLFVLNFLEVQLNKLQGNTQIVLLLLDYFPKEDEKSPSDEDQTVFPLWRRYMEVKNKFCANQQIISTFATIRTHLNKRDYHEAHSALRGFINYQETHDAERTLLNRAKLQIFSEILSWFQEKVCQFRDFEELKVIKKELEGFIFEDLHCHKEALQDQDTRENVEKISIHFKQLFEQLKQIQETLQKFEDAFRLNLHENKIWIHALEVQQIERLYLGMSRNMKERILTLFRDHPNRSANTFTRRAYLTFHDFLLNRTQEIEPFALALAEAQHYAGVEETYLQKGTEERKTYLAAQPEPYRQELMRYLQPVLTTTPFFETRWTERLRRNIACSDTLEHRHRIIGLSLKGLLPQEVYTHLYTDLEAVQKRLLGDGRSQLTLIQPYLPLHLVSDPEQIGSIFAAEALVQQLFDPIEHEWIETLAPDSEYGSPFLFSKAVEGSTLQSKDVKCDPEAFSKQLFIWLLTGYQSDPEWLTCLEKYRKEGKPHYEVVPHSYKGAFKGFSFENGQLCHQLEEHPFVKMKEMDRPIHDNVRREILRLPVDLVMLNALTDLIQRNQRAKRVTSFVRVSCYEDAKNMVTEPLAIPAGLFTALSHLYIRMQELLKANKQITHRQLLEQLYPSGPARAERRTYQSPQEAYDMLRGRLKEFGEIVRVRQQLKRGVPFEEIPEQFDAIISGIPGILEPLQIHTLPACVRPVLYQTLQSKPVSHLNVASCSDLKEFEKIISTSKATLRSLNLVGVKVSLTSVLQLQELEELKLGFQAECQLLLNLPKLRSLELSDMSALTTVKGMAPQLALITVTKCSLLETLFVETHVKGQIVGCPLDTLMTTALELASTPVLSCNDPFKNRIRPILEVEIPCEPQLDLSGLTIGSNEMEVVCRLLETRSWPILDFSNCKLMTSALTPLQGKTFPIVTGLNLSGAKGFSEAFLDHFPKLYLLYLSHTKVIPSLAAHNELKILHLDHCGLTAQSLEKLKPFFKEHHSLDILNVSHNQLGDAGVAALRKLLLQMHVRHLDLSFNNFSLSTLNASIESLHVDHLDVSGNRCADDAYVPWEVFLRKSMVASLKMHSLQFKADPHLSLLANTFKGRAMRMLSVADNPELFIYHNDEYLDVLMNNLFFKSLSTIIEALNFANTGLDKRGIKMLAAILLHIRSLKELNLSRNQLTPEDLAHLVERTPIIRLRTLDISGNPLSTQQGLNAVLKLFHKYLPKLETFICNDLRSSDDLTDFFKQLATDRKSHLTTLSLVRCGSLHKRDTLVELRNALHTHPNIHTLILDGNNIGKEALKALLTGLPPTIRTLSIRHNLISPADARDWLHLVGSTHLTQLDLSPDMLAPADLPTLHTHLRKNFNK